MHSKHRRRRRKTRGRRRKWEDEGSDPGYGLESFRETNLDIFPSAAFILLSICSIMTPCTESPITKKLPFGSSLILEILKLGWYCFNSPFRVLQFLNFSSTPLNITGIEFFILGLGCTGVLRGGLEEHGLGWLGSIGE